MTKLAVTFLGTSSATPTRSRSLPCIAMTRDGEVILMDCGEGAQAQIVKHRVGLGRRMLILITHLHGDHVNGLVGLLQTMSMVQREVPVIIIAPNPLLRWLRTTIEALNIGLTFELRFVPAKQGLLYRCEQYRIRAARAHHAVESFAYLFEEYPRPGTFDPQKALNLGIPEGKKWSTIQRGRAVIVNGRRFRPGDVMGRKRPGRRVGYSGDTRPSASLSRFFKDCDLLIFDSTFSAEDSDRARERMHSTSVEAASLAKGAGAKRLVLTHFSARYRNVGKLLREARTIMPDSVAAYDGLTIEVPYPQN